MATITLSEKVKDLNSRNSELFSQEAYCDLAKDNFKLNEKVKSLESALNIANKGLNSVKDIKKELSDLEVEIKDFLRFIHSTTYDGRYLSKISGGGWMRLLKLFLEDDDYRTRHILNQIDYSGYSPLTLAIENRSFQVVNLLIQSGAYIARSDGKGFSPLTKAVSVGRIEIVSLLLEYGTNPNVPDSNEMLPMYWAIINRDTTLMKFLIDNGATLNMVDGGGWLPLTYAIDLRFI